MTKSEKKNSDPLIGRVIDGRFELVKLISRGAAGRVYRAIQQTTNRVVAVKLLDFDESPEHDILRQHFFLQACLSARVTHTHVVRIFDYGCDDDLFYLATEYLDSGTVSELVRQEGMLLPARALSIAKQASSGLAEAHEHGLVHGDLRPSNLVLTQRRGQDWVKIHVLGLASGRGISMPSKMTGPLPKVSGFSAPERLLGGAIDERTDTFGVGAILLFMLTGLSAKAIEERMAGADSSGPFSLSRLNPKLADSSGLEEVIQTCLAPDPADRYQAIRDLIHALDAVSFSSAAAQSTIDSNPGVQSLESSSDNTSTSASDLLASLLASGHRSGRDDLSETGFAETADLSEDGCAQLIERALPDMVWGHDPPEQESVIDLDRLNAVNLDEYVAYIDLNCPFCYAHHERLCGWGQGGRLQWRLVEHASHIIDGPFDVAQETILAREVLSLHRRAPDVNVVLPPRRYSSMLATRLVIYVQREYPETREALLTGIYRALWREGLDIGDEQVLSSLLEANDLPLSLLDRCHAAPAEMAVWQHSWESADYDTCIPVTTHVPSGRVLVGLPDERVLMEFFLGARSRLLDNAVCFYRPRPAILLCGTLSDLWPLLTTIRQWADIIVKESIAMAQTLLSGAGRIDMVIVHADVITQKTRDPLVKLCAEIEVPWLWATLTPNDLDESAALSAGAAEYLPVVGDAAIARSRLNRLIVDRLIQTPMDVDGRTDPMTGLADRRGFIEYLAAQWEHSRISRRPLSLLFINLDRFKAFNAVEGILAGDERLKGVARAIEQTLEGADPFLARIGGDIFVVLLAEESAERAQEFAERLRIIIRSQRFVAQKGSNPPLLTASIGVATRRVLSGIAPDVLIEAAEEACRAAKQDGRDQVAVR